MSPAIFACTRLELQLDSSLVFNRTPTAGINHVPCTRNFWFVKSKAICRAAISTNIVCVPRVHLQHQQQQRKNFCFLAFVRYGCQAAKPNPNATLAPLTPSFFPSPSSSTASSPSLFASPCPSPSLSESFSLVAKFLIVCWRFRWFAAAKLDSLLLIPCKERVDGEGMLLKGIIVIAVNLCSRQLLSWFSHLNYFF